MNAIFPVLHEVSPLVLICLIALLVFIHHLARSIIADTIIDRVGSALDRDVERLLPESEVDADTAFIRPSEGGAALTLHRSGYVQSLNHGGMVRLAKEAGAVIELSVKPGRHVIEGSNFGWIAPPHAATAETRTKIEKCSCRR